MPARATLMGLLVMACACSSGNRQAEVANGPPVKPEETSLGPYTARVVGELDDCTREVSFTYCVLQVRDVRAYGPSTHPLPSGTTLEVRVHESTLQRYGVTSVKDGASIDATVSYLRPVGSPETTPLWIIERIH